jgi:hypothetical protein
MELNTVCQVFPVPSLNGYDVDGNGGNGGNSGNGGSKSNVAPSVLMFLSVSVVLLGGLNYWRR